MASPKRYLKNIIKFFDYFSRCLLSLQKKKSFRSFVVALDQKVLFAWRVVLRALGACLEKKKVELLLKKRHFVLLLDFAKHHFLVTPFLFQNFSLENME